MPVLLQHHNGVQWVFHAAMSARERHIDPALQGKMLASLRQVNDNNDVEAMRRQLRKLVLEYRPADEINAAVSDAFVWR